MRSKADWRFEYRKDGSDDEDNKEDHGEEEDHEEAV